MVRARSGLLALAVLALAGCVATPEATVTTSATTQVTVKIEGTYSHVVTEAQLRAAGVTDPSDIAENVGSFLFTFDDGRWRYEQRGVPSAEEPDASWTGSYRLDRDRITIYWSQVHRDNNTAATVEVRADGSLRFTDIEDAWGQEMSVGFFQGSPWTPVGP